jgi:hypothetical protein
LTSDFINTFELDMATFAPLDVLLSWPVPNYVDPVTRDTRGYFALCTIFFSLATVAVTARFYARIIVRHWVGLDDVFVAIAYVSLPLAGHRIERIVKTN